MTLKSPITPNRNIAHIIERQMRNWELARSTTRPEATHTPQEVHDFVALSRSVGLPGERVALRLGERLGWPVFDKELLHEMAGNDAYRERLYRVMDERDLSWLETVVQSADMGHPVRDDYFNRLRRTVLALSRKAPMIFLGRAADLILPRTHGLRVRLTAPHEHCVRCYAAAHHVSEGEAEGAIRRIEQDRAKFFRQHFHVDPVDPTRHDMVLNLQRLSEEQAADMILAALRIKHILK